MLKNLYLSHRFFAVLGAIVAVFLLAFLEEKLLPIAYALLYTFVGLCLGEYFWLFHSKEKLEAVRKLSEKFSLSDENEVSIWFRSYYTQKVDIRLIDELPFHFQQRQFALRFYKCNTNQQHTTYALTPKERGVLTFGRLNAYVSFSFLGFLVRRFSFSQEAQVAVYPSFVQMKKYQQLAFSSFLLENGLQKIRRVGHSMEFDHIGEYVVGDDIRSLNWKATSKRNKLMINVFAEEKSQQVYSIIDKGRIMEQPFEGLSLLDYAINTTLAISNIVVKKHDKAGMLTFSTAVEDIVLAGNQNKQMLSIMEKLYAVKTSFQETDFEQLYSYIRRKITHRSLLMLYTNFDTLDALHRQLPYLIAIAKRHLLVVIIFKNSQLQQLLHSSANALHQMYDKAIAEQFEMEKHLIVQELSKHGILHILSTPKELTLDSINKYLEVKKTNWL